MTKRLMLVLCIGVVGLVAVGCEGMQGNPDNNTAGAPQAIPYDHVHVSALYQQAMGLIAENNFTEAMNVLDTAIRIGGHNYMSYTLRGEVRLKAAAVDFQHALAFVQGDPYATQMLMETAQALRKTHGKELYQTAVICKMNNDIKGAVDCYTELLKYSPGNPWILCERGNLYSMVGEWDGAIADYTAVLAVFPEHEVAKAFLEMAKGHKEGTVKQPEQPAPAPEAPAPAPAPESPK